jgi:hypothetical protein
MFKDLYGIREIRSGEIPLSGAKSGISTRLNDEEFVRVYPPKVQRAYVPTAEETNFFAVHSRGFLRSR